MNKKMKIIIGAVASVVAITAISVGTVMYMNSNQSIPIDDTTADNSSLIVDSSSKITIDKIEISPIEIEDDKEKDKEKEENSSTLQDKDSPQGEVKELIIGNPKNMDLPKTEPTVETEPAVKTEIVKTLENNESYNQIKGTVSLKASKTSVKFGKKYMVVYNGKTRQIKASASDKGKVTYTTSDKSVATVNQSGTVIGKANGVAYITATLKSNKKVTARCYIYVMKAYNNNKKPQDGDEKYVNGVCYSYDSFNKMSGASKDGWTKLDLFGETSFCTYCNKYIATKANGKPCKGFCDGVHDAKESIKNFKCSKCKKGYYTCKCEINAYM